MAEYQEYKDRFCSLIPDCKTKASLVSNLSNLTVGSLKVHSPCKVDATDFYCQSSCKTPYPPVVSVPCSEIRGRGFNFFPERSCASFCEFFKSPFSLSKTHPPKWLKYDGIKLNFYAYWQEPIPESPLETYRVHQCQITFHPVDDTIEVCEPSTFDPGYAQGKIIHRQKIPLAPFRECCTGALLPDEFFTLDHFQIGCDVTLFGKTFYITGVDEFTRSFLQRSGVSVPFNMDMPIDPATECRKDAFLAQFYKGSGFRARPTQEQERLKRYLKFYRKVLCFGALWDDRCNDPPAALRRFHVLFFLEDGTMQIREEIPDNSGFEPRYRIFLARSRVQKSPAGPYLTQIGGGEQEVILNVDHTKSSLHSRDCMTFLPDRLNPGDGDPEFYSDSDLAIGATINIYGRAFILMNADLFTQEYYRENYNIQDFTPLQLDEPTCPLPKMETPPHNGIGDEEETYINWNKVPFDTKPPRKNTLINGPFDAKDILCFSANLVDCQHKVNSERKFSIQYHMVDGSLAILERAHPNSGFKAGVFLHRGKVKSAYPDPERIENSGECPSKFIGPEDLFIGNILYINGFKFQIYGANEVSLALMERYFECFPHCNLSLIMEKMREIVGPIPMDSLLQAFSVHDGTSDGVMCLDTFRNILLCLSQRGLSGGEILTLQRAYRTEPCEPGIDWNTFQSVIQTELRKNHFDKPLMERMEYTFRELDPCRGGVIDRESLRAVMKGAKVPLDRDLLDFFVDRFPGADSCDRVDYCCLLKFIDWELNAVHIAKPTSICCVMKWIHPQRPLVVFCVNYRQFLEDLVPNIKCALPAVCCPPVQGQEVDEEYQNSPNDYCEFPDPGSYPTLHCNYLEDNENFIRNCPC